MGKYSLRIDQLEDVHHMPRDKCTSKNNVSITCLLCSMPACVLDLALIRTKRIKETWQHGMYALMLP